MKKFSGIIKCRRCGGELEWMYIDDGHRTGSLPYIAYPISLEDYGSFAPCSRKIIIPRQSELFTTHCPHWQADVSIECSERILEELYAKSWWLNSTRKTLWDLRKY